MARILMILDQSFPPDIRVENEARSLAEAGFEVTILAIGPDQRRKTDRLGEVRVIRDRMPATIRNKMRGLAGTIPLMEFYVAHRMKMIHSVWPYDFVHAHDLYLVGGALKAGRSLAIKVVSDLHENWVAALEQYAWSNRFPARLFINLKRWDRLETAWASSSDAVVVVIEEMAERLALKGVPEKLLTVVPNTVHTNSFDAYGIDKALAESIRSPLTMLYTGGMDRHRGIETAIRAMPLILETVPDARLVLVGDGAVRTDLEKLAASIGLGNAVRFEGWKSQDTIPSYIAGADIGLIPHVKTEHTDHTIPHKLFHYMHMGLPVLASNCKPLERILTETAAGMIHASGDHDALASTVLQLVRDDDARNQMGQNGRRAVANKYNWNYAGTALVTLYRELLKMDLREKSSA